MKKYFLTVAAVALCSVMSIAQIHMNSAGNVGVGTSTISWDAKLEVNGHIRANANNAKFKIHPNATIWTASPTALGANNGRLAFWYSSWGYNKIWAQELTETSDSTLKTNITPLEHGLESLLKLNTYSYNFRSDAQNPNAKLSYGFLAQELEQIIPDLTDTCLGAMGIKTTQMIPVLVNGIKEQQQIIDKQSELIASMEKELSEIERATNEIADHVGVNLSTDSPEPAAVLYQNKPNPFKDQTIIKYELPETFSSASIMVFDLSGVLLENFPLSRQQNGELVIRGGQLKAGMYLYTLVVDDVEVDTKKMILQKNK